MAFRVLWSRVVGMVLVLCSALAFTVGLSTTPAFAASAGYTQVTYFTFSYPVFSGRLVTTAWTRQNITLHWYFTNPYGSQFGAGQGTCDNSTSCERGPSTVDFNFYGTCPLPGKYTLTDYAVGSRSGRSNSDSRSIVVTTSECGG